MGHGLPSAMDAIRSVLTELGLRFGTKVMKQIRKYTLQKVA
jgi:hypothetical protein